MGLAGAWPDVSGTPEFILLALHVGHNATFVTFGGLRRGRAPSVRGYSANKLLRTVGKLQLRAQAPRNGNCTVDMEKLWNKTVWSRRGVAMTN